MSLEDEIKLSRKKIVADGYEMSIGELISLYRDNELVINPEFQRLFRWDESQKTRFIESLLLGIPIPPIFVFQTQTGVWELVDGLQRVSTVFEFVGILRGDSEQLKPRSTLIGTKLLPSLEGKCWAEDDDNTTATLPPVLRLDIKRARLRVEILKSESDPIAKYELFQRLNTGGSILSPQEVRNCTAVMIDREFFEWLRSRAELASFKHTIAQTEPAERKQMPMELALRFVAYRNIPYVPGLDVHQYLDDATIQLARHESFDWETESHVFEETFRILDEALGDSAFKRWDGGRFTGKFLMSVFEVVAVGVSYSLDHLSTMQPTERNEFLNLRAATLWENDEFQRNSGAGVDGRTRLKNLLPLARNYFCI